MYDYLIQDAKVVDGTGSPWYRADVAIQDGRIAAIGRLSGAATARAIEADGLILCPGFVDAHVHGDTVMLGDPAMEAAVRQGAPGSSVGLVSAEPAVLSRRVDSATAQSSGIPTRVSSPLRASTTAPWSASAPLPTSTTPSAPTNKAEKSS